MPDITIRTERTLTVPDYGTRLDIFGLQELVRRSGSHFFDHDTMRPFRSKVDDLVYAGPDGWYFVTSEKHVAYTSYDTINEPRLYTVRRMSIVTRDNGSQDIGLHELEKFQAFASLRMARRAAKYAATVGVSLCTTCGYRVTLNPPCAVCKSRTRRLG